VNDETLETRLGELEKLTAPLEPDASTRAELMKLLEAHTGRFLDSVRGASTYNAPDEGLSELSTAFPENSRAAEDVFALIGAQVDQPGITPASPRFMGYVPGGGLFYAALGDFLADISNKYAGLSFISPGAVRVENAVIKWMANAIGLPDTAHGTLTSGGSIANLLAVVAARDAAGVAGAKADKVSIYFTNHVHHCLFKALHVAGLSDVNRRVIPTDDAFRMRVDALRSAMADDVDAGLTPWLVVGSAGTVATGAVDPLQEIGAACRECGAWFHVDGAYGGLFTLCPEGATALAGIELADTVVLDPHKTLFLPYGTGAVIARDRTHLLKPFSSDASYIQDFVGTDEEVSPSNMSIELTRHFRGLRLWLSLQLAGVSAFRAALSEKILLARYFHQRVAALSDFEVGPAPDLSIVAFRYVPPGRDANEVNTRLLKKLQEGGEVFLSGAEIDERFTLRCAIMSFRTHLGDVKRAVDAIAATAAEV